MRMMTSEKFTNLVKTRLKEKNNNLDETDIVDIGIAHRELPKAERSWSKVANMINWTGSGESLRCFVLRRLKEKDMILSNEETDENIAKKKALLYRERQQVRDEWSTYHRMMRSEARFEILKELIENSIRQLKPIKHFDKSLLFKQSTTDDAEGILMLSDWHIGQDCNNFYNSYNIEIARSRVATIIDSTIEYCRKFKINTLHVLNLGDLIEGKINSTGRVESNERTLKQLMEATEIMANALNKLSTYVPNVTYRSVVDNHSSIDKNYKDRLPEENLNLLTTWYLKARLIDSNIQFKDDNLDIGLGRFSLRNGMNVAFFHGHEDPKDKTLQNLVGATHEWTDVVCAAHLHNPAEHVYQDMRLFVNGSLCGTGPYALSHRLFTKPSQKLIVIENKNFVNIDLSAMND